MNLPGARDTSASRAPTAAVGAVLRRQGHGMAARHHRGL